MAALTGGSRHAAKRPGGSAQSNAGAEYNGRMYTQCPRCLTIYEVDEDALQASLGIVCCGQCSERFDALRTLSDHLPPSAALDLPTRDSGESVPVLTEMVAPELIPPSPAPTRAAEPAAASAPASGKPAHDAAPNPREDDLWIAPHADAQARALIAEAAGIPREAIDAEPEWNALDAVPPASTATPTVDADDGARVDAADLAATTMAAGAAVSEPLTDAWSVDLLEPETAAADPADAVAPRTDAAPRAAVGGDEIIADMPPGAAASGALTPAWGVDLARPVAHAVAELIATSARTEPRNAPEPMTSDTESEDDDWLHAESFETARAELESSPAPTPDARAADDDEAAENAGATDTPDAQASDNDAVPSANAADAAAGEAADEEAPASQLVEPDAEPAADADDAAPIYIPPRRARLRRGDALWLAGSVVLAVALAAQLAWAGRAALVRDPATRDLALRACATIDCRLPPIRDIARLELLSRDVRPDPARAGALAITATLRNNAPFRQPWPVVVVTLTDLDNRPVAMRRFRAAEYMPDPVRRAAGLASGATAAVAFEVADPGKRAVSFQFGFD